jgi:hypothetical protein
MVVLEVEEGAGNGSCTPINMQSSRKHSPCQVHLKVIMVVLEDPRFQELIGQLVVAEQLELEVDGCTRNFHTRTMLVLVELESQVQYNRFFSRKSRWRWRWNVCWFMCSMEF